MSRELAPYSFKGKTVKTQSEEAYTRLHAGNEEHKQHKKDHGPHAAKRKVTCKTKTTLPLSGQPPLQIG